MQTSVGYPEIPEAGCIVTFGLSWDQSTQRQTDIVMRDDLRCEKKRKKEKKKPKQTSLRSNAINHLASSGIWANAL